jgi:hypothetical protein
MPGRGVPLQSHLMAHCAWKMWHWIRTVTFLWEDWNITSWGNGGGRGKGEKFLVLDREWGAPPCSGLARRWRGICFCYTLIRRHTIWINNNNNGLAASESAILSCRGAWEHLELLRITGEVDRSIWGVRMCLPDRCTFCWWYPPFPKMASSSMSHCILSSFGTLDVLTLNLIQIHRWIPIDSCQLTH